MATIRGFASNQPSRGFHRNLRRPRSAGKPAPSFPCAKASPARVIPLGQAVAVPLATNGVRHAPSQRNWSSFSAMEEKLRQLLQDAFGEAAARDANAAIARARRGPTPRAIAADDGPGLRLYEIILTGFAAFASDLLPKLVYHLESIGAHLPDCRGVLIAAFVGER